MNKAVLYKLNYGVYIVSAPEKEGSTGCTVNSVVQITQDIIAVSVNRSSYTNECMKNSRRFAISVLGIHSAPIIIGTFGFRCGRNFRKFDAVPHITVDGIDIVKEACGYIICDLEQTVETDTHTIFLGRMKAGELINDDEPMTYSYYHKVIRGKTPKAAPTYQAEEVKKQI